MSVADRSLIDQARQAAKRSNASPEGRTGAVAETVDGKRFAGAAITVSGALGLSGCAEQIALSAARAASTAKIKTLALWIPKAATDHPCGRCLQICVELAPEATILLQRGDEEPRELTLAELIPEAFTDFKKR